jgi:hypothetical protein
LQDAGLHDGDAVAHRHGLDLVVGDVDRRGLEIVLELRDVRAHLDAQLRVEVRERLVHQEDLRLPHDRAPHRDTLPLAARQLLRLPVEELRQVEKLRSPRHPPVDLVLRLPPQPQAEGDVLVDGEMRVERIVLEHHRHIPFPRGQRVDNAVADAQLALGDLLESGHHPQRGRLAAPGGPDENQELPVRDVQRQVVDGVEAVVVDLLDAFELDLSH